MGSAGGYMTCFHWTVAGTGRLVLPWQLRISCFPTTAVSRAQMIGSGCGTAVGKTRGSPCL
jgi:hypothetical protein